MVRWPPELWSELERLVPEGGRSAFVRAAVERALKRKAVRQVKTSDQPDPGADLEALFEQWRAEPLDPEELAGYPEQIAPLLLREVSVE